MCPENEGFCFQMPAYLLSGDLIARSKLGSVWLVPNPNFRNRNTSDIVVRDDRGRELLRRNEVPDLWTNDNTVSSILSRDGREFVIIAQYSLKQIHRLWLDDLSTDTNFADGRMYRVSPSGKWLLSNTPRSIGRQSFDPFSLRTGKLQKTRVPFDSRDREMMRELKVDDQGCIWGEKLLRDAEGALPHFMGVYVWKFGDETFRRIVGSRTSASPLLINSIVQESTTIHALIDEHMNAVDLCVPDLKNFRLLPSRHETVKSDNKDSFYWEVQCAVGNSSIEWEFDRGDGWENHCRCFWRLATESPRLVAAQAGWITDRNRYYLEVPLITARDSLRTLCLANLAWNLDASAYDHRPLFSNIQPNKLPMSFSSQLPDDDCRKVAAGFLDWKRRFLRLT